MYVPLADWRTLAHINLAETQARLGICKTTNSSIQTKPKENSLVAPALHPNLGGQTSLRAPVGW